MRYIANSAGYLQYVSFGAMIECNGQGCTAYTGGVPSGYSSLTDWFALECDKLHRWHIVEGELTLDPDAKEPPAYVEPETESFLIPITAMEKIWTNDKPGDAFSGQTVSLDLSSSDGVSILYKNESGGTLHMNTGYIPKGCKGRMSYLSQSSGKRSERRFTASNSGVEFEDGAYSDGNSSNIHCIPVEIYAWSQRTLNVYKTTNPGSAICGAFVCGELVCGQ
jgi:hypothetical protein